MRLAISSGMPLVSHFALPSLENIRYGMRFLGNNAIPTEKVRSESVGGVGG